MKNLTPENLCGSNFGYGKFSLETCLNDMAELGLKKFEMWGWAPHFHVDHVGNAEIASLKEKLSSRNIELACYTPEQMVYPVNIASADETLRSTSVTFFKRAAEIASELDCPFLFVTCGWGYYEEASETAWPRSIESMRQITEYAQKLGVVCITESLQPQETNLVLTAKDVKRYLDEVGSSNLKTALDTGAMAIQGEEPSDHFELYGDTIAHCHFIDAIPRKVSHLIWGDGELPMKEYLQYLDGTGYSGLLTVEMNPGRYGMDPTRFLSDSIGRLSKALS